MAEPAWPFAILRVQDPRSEEIREFLLDWSKPSGSLAAECWKAFGYPETSERIEFMDALSHSVVPAESLCYTFGLRPDDLVEIVTTGGSV